MMRVPVEPGLLRWACERSRLPQPRLHHRFRKLFMQAARREGGLEGRARLVLGRAT